MVTFLATLSVKVQKNFSLEVCFLQRLEYEFRVMLVMIKSKVKSSARSLNMQKQFREDPERRMHCWTQTKKICCSLTSANYNEDLICCKTY